MTSQRFGDLRQYAIRNTQYLLRITQYALLGGFSLCAPSAFSADLPSWYTANRIQYHFENTALLKAEKRTLEQWCAWLKSAHQDLVESGAKVTVTTGRHGAEGAWWPTTVGESHDRFQGRDILADDIIGDFRARGLKTIIYYRHDIDFAMQDAHPEWIARNADGSLVEKPRGVKIYNKTAYQMCQNSPFRAFTKQRLIEIFERGAGGVYFDEDHMPEVCFCENCKRAFLEKHGRPMPENPQPGTAAYLEVARFVGESLTGAFTEWKTAVQQINPQAVLLVSASGYAQFTGLHETEEMARAGSANKTEFQKCFGGQQHFPQADVQRLKAANPSYWLPPRDLCESLEWMISRDVQGGNPPHIWVAYPDPNDPDEVLHTAAAVVAHGAIAGMGLPLRKQYVANYRKTFAMNDSLAPFMQDARPYAWVVIHVSNELKERLYVEGGTNILASYQHRFEHLYAPVAGAANVLHKAHLPFATISDTLLKKGEFAPETKVLLVPAYDLLSPEVRAASDASGLKVIKLSGDWHLDAAQAALGASLLPMLGQPPVSVEGPDNLFATFMVNKASGDLLVSLVRDWNWFWFFNKKPGQIRTEEIGKQPAIENVKIHSPGQQTVLYPASESVNDPLNICRFIQINMKQGE
jgi:hypothetical protein